MKQQKLIFFFLLDLAFDSALLETTKLVDYSSHPVLGVESEKSEEAILLENLEAVNQFERYDAENKVLIIAFILWTDTYRKDDKGRKEEKRMNERMPESMMNE